MFWERFYEICKEKKTTPNKVAKQIGLSTGIATKWKNGSVPRKEVLELIAKELNVSETYLLGYTIERNPKEAPSVDETSEVNSALVELARSCPEEKADLMLRVMRAILQDEGE